MSPAVSLNGGRSGLRLRSGQLAVIGVLLALAIVAWVVSDLRMAGMDAGPGTDPGAFGFYITTWVLMMAAMMFPSIAPMVLMFRNLQRGRRSQGKSVPSGVTTLFVSGYLLAWAGWGLLGYAVLKGGRALDGGLFSWVRAGRWAAAAVLLGAALYEFTPFKSACLTRCRSPLGFLLGSWRDGRAGALRLGVEHGGWCLGCCWALMVALFALGAMSMTWMLLVAALIAAEKLLPWRSASTAGVALVLAALAVGVATSPSSVPALTVPGRPNAMGTMSRHGAAINSSGAAMKSSGAAMKSSGAAMKSSGAATKSSMR